MALGFLFHSLIRSKDNRSLTLCQDVASVLTEPFPFPLLGLDTDNGTEFINDALLTYCEAQQITFTRGRPLLKNDQCYVEQKNGQMVRQVVGTYRYVGEQAFHCLHELYRILSQSVNFFQPSMKLCAKLKEGRKVRRVYDPAKTPLTRLLLTHLLPTEQERDLMKRFCQNWERKGQ